MCSPVDPECLVILCMMAPFVVTRMMCIIYITPARLYESVILVEVIFQYYVLLL